MFNFTTTTIVNSNVDPTTGKNRFEVISKDGANKDLKDVNGEKYSVLKLRRNLDIKSTELGCWEVYKTASAVATAAEIYVDLSELGDIVAGDTYRLALYIKLSGSQNSYYANDSGFRGKPLFVEAVAPSTSAADLANEFVANAKKYMLMMYEYDVVELSADGSTLTIKATDEYQRFVKAAIQTYPVNTPCCECCAPYTESMFKDVLTLENGDFEVEALGNEGFGTYVHLMKDYRLPTGANSRWNRIALDEAPIPGATYTQYTMYFTKNRGLFGGAAVGQQVVSKTCHVFWVNDYLVSAFDTALSSIGITLSDATVGGHDEEYIPTHMNKAKEILKRVVEDSDATE